MKQRLTRAIRFFLAMVSVLFGAMWIVFAIPPVSSWICARLSEKISKESGMSVSIGSASLYLPFYVEFRDIQVSLKNSDKPSLSMDSLRAVPLLLDLPFGRLSFIYTHFYGIDIDIPQAISESKEGTQSATPPSFEQLQKTAHTLFGNGLALLPYHLYIGHGNATIHSVRMSGQEMMPPIAINGFSLSLDPKLRSGAVSLSMTPLSPYLKKYVDLANFALSFTEDLAPEPTFHFQLNGSCQLPERRAGAPIYNHINLRTGKKLLAFSLELDKNAGTWSYQLFDSMDYLYGTHYAASSSEGRGACTLSSHDIEVSLDTLKGDLTLFAQMAPEGAMGFDDREPEIDLSEVPIDLSLLAARKANSLLKTSFISHGGFIRLDMAPKAPIPAVSNKGKKTKALEPSQKPFCEYSLPNIQVHCSNCAMKSSLTRTYSFSGTTSLPNGNFSGIEAATYIREGADTTSPIGTIKAKFDFKNGFLSNGLLPMGSLSLSSPVLSFSYQMAPSFERQVASFTLKASSLNSFQELSPEPIDGEASFLTSITYTPQEPFAWQIDTILGALSDFRYGSQIRVENAAFALSFDPNMSRTVGTYLVKNGSFGHEHWINSSKGAMTYDMEKGLISISHGAQRGIAWKTPYAVRYQGQVKKRDLIHGYVHGTLIEGSFSSQGTLGNDPFSFDLNTTIPLKADGAIFQRADLAISGNIGTKGQFSLSCFGADWQARKFLLHGAFTSIPSSLVTEMASLPAGQGLCSGQVHLQTNRGRLQMNYEFDGSFSWLERMPHIHGLQLSASGGINNGQLESRLLCQTPHQKEGPLSNLECSLSVPIEERTSSFPFCELLYNTPISGSIQGSTDFQTLISPWLEEEEWVEGQMNISAKIGGTLNSQKITGNISLTQGKLDILALGGVLSDISIHGTLYGKEIYIDDLRASDDKQGTFHGKGSLLLPIPGKRPFSWRAEAGCSHFEIINLEYAKVSISGAVKLAGTVESMSIEATAESDLALIDVSKRFTLPIPDVHVVYAQSPSEEKKKASIKKNEPPQKPFEFLLNIQVQTKAPLEIYGRGLESTWTGSASLLGSLSHPKIEGSFGTNKGSFIFAGKDFTISQGSVSFGGDLIRESRLSLTAHADLPNVAARVLLRGTLDNPKVTLESNPMKGEKEILSLILFNKEICDITPLESLQLASTAMTLDQSTAPLQFLEAVKKAIGIDMIDFGTSKDTTHNDVCVRVGKYLSQGVTVNVSKDFTSDANRIGVEVEVAKNISAEAEIGDDSEGVVSIKWKKDF